MLQLNSKNCWTPSCKNRTMRKGRLPAQSSGKGQSGDEEGREPCTCSNSNFITHVCRQCQELICVKCRSGDHRHHACDKIDVVAGELRNDIGDNVSKQTKSDVSDFVQKGKQLIVKMRKELITIETTEIDKIDKHVNELHRELDEIRMDLVKTVNTIVRKDIEYLKDAELDLDKTAQDIKSMHAAAKSMLEKASDIEVIKGGYSLCRLLKNISTTKVTTPTKGQAFSVQFVAGKCNRQSLQNMIGETSVQSGNDQADIQTTKHSQPTTPVPVPSAIGATSGMPAQSENQETRSKMPAQSEKQGTISKVGLEIVTSVSVSGVDGGIWGVCGTADDKCWFTDCYSPDIKLVDMTGTRHRTVTVGGGCYGITTDGRSMYVTCGDRSIKKISTDHKVTATQTSLSFHPRGLTRVPVTGELLVCGRNDGVFSVTDSGVRRTLTGVKFQYAWDVAVSNNGDICVTDRNKVFIFNSDKRHVGTYDGHGTSIQNTIDARGVTCDSRGNFIVADRNNHVLHIITRDGDNVSIYDTTKDCKDQPCWIDISPSGRLWVSFGRDKICVYDMI